MAFHQWYLFTPLMKDANFNDVGEFTIFYGDSTAIMKSIPTGYLSACNGYAWKMSVTDADERPLSIGSKTAKNILKDFLDTYGDNYYRSLSWIIPLHT